MNIESFEIILFISFKQEVGHTQIVCTLNPLWQEYLINLHIKGWPIRNPPYYKVSFIKLISNQRSLKGGPHYITNIITSVMLANIKKW